MRESHGGSGGSLQWAHAGDGATAAKESGRGRGVAAADDTATERCREASDDSGPGRRADQRRTLSPARVRALAPPVQASREPRCSARKQAALRPKRRKLAYAIIMPLNTTRIALRGAPRPPSRRPPSRGPPRPPTRRPTRPPTRSPHAACPS